MADTSKITLGQLKTALTQAKNYTDNEIAEVNNINDTAASATTTYSSNKIETIKEGIRSEIKEKQGIGIKEVEPINTTFIEDFISENILDPTTIKSGTLKGSVGSAAFEAANDKFLYFKLEIKENSNYTVTGTSYYYYILDGNDIILERGSDPSANVPNVTIDTPQNAKYLVVNFRPKTYPTETYMVVNGTEMPSKYVPFYNCFKLTKDLYEGISYEKVYVSASGNDSDDGLSFHSPLKTFQKAIDLGATTIIGIGGTYGAQTIKAENKTNLKIITDNMAYNGNKTNKITIDNSKTIDFTLNASNGLYESNMTFDTGTNWYKVFIDKTLAPIRPDLRSESYNCILWETCNDFTKDKKLIPVLSLDECLSTQGSFYYDGTTISLNPTDGTIDNKSYRRLVIEEGNILSFSAIQNLTLEDIEVLFPPENALYINRCSNAKVTSSNFGYSAYDTNVVTDRSNVQFNYCKSYKATGDGFGPTNSGNHDFINCYGFYNYDDGVSHHDGCTGRVQGGEYYNNVKGGVAPAHGAVVSMENIISHNNGYGFYCQADRNIGRNQNLMNCVAYENNYGISVKNYHIKTFNCKFDNNTKPSSITPDENTSLTVL